MIPSIPCWLSTSFLGSAAFPIWLPGGDTFPLEESHGTPLPAKHPPRWHHDESRLLWHACRFYSHEQKPRFSWTSHYLSGCSIAHSTSFKPGTQSSDFLTLPLPLTSSSCLPEASLGSETGLFTYSQWLSFWVDLLRIPLRFRRPLFSLKKSPFFSHMLLWISKTSCGYQKLNGDVLEAFLL